MSTTVTIAVSMGEDGRPDAGSIRLIDAQGGSDAGAQSAFDAARRAILRCARDGYPLPRDKFDQWRELELVFDPSGMRLR
jgi:hypothetical protein